MRLRDLREDYDMTQTTLADLLHVKQNTYSQYENGQRQIPIEVLIQLASIFKTSTDYLLGITDDPRPYPRGKTRM
ncbi:MAG: helix-turn-helix transcriptional regulator [Clostridia bacterium]|nr:helix-turn-helix transcriptional regulator [Clostridia bacterium]